jgi:hypothetical protein
MPQTLPKQDRKHPSIIKTHDREILLSSNTLLVFNVFKAGDGSAVGYVAIKDRNRTYEFSDKVFFKESSVKITTDFELKNNPNSVLGYVEIDEVNTNYNKLGTNKTKKVISFAESKRRQYLNSLTPKEMDIYRMYYKTRVIAMERKQGTIPLETALLDKVEYMKAKIGQKFNKKNFMKGICKEYNFKFEKLNSGFQKRMACKRWAKVDFNKNHRKFIRE